MKIPTARASAVAILLSLAALLDGAAPLSAQWRDAPTFPAAQRSLPLGAPVELRHADAGIWREPTTFGVTAAGVGAAFVGSFGGAIVGSYWDDEFVDWGAVVGWFVGSAVTTPLGVHLANGRRGSLGSAYFPAAVIAGAAIGGLLAIGSEDGGILVLAAPAAQVLSAVVTERLPPRTPD